MENLGGDLEPILTSLYIVIKISKNSSHLKNIINYFEITVNLFSMHLKMNFREQ